MKEILRNNNREFSGTIAEFSGAVGNGGAFPVLSRKVFQKRMA